MPHSVKQRLALLRRRKNYLEELDDAGSYDKAEASSLKWALERLDPNGLITEFDLAEVIPLIAKWDEWAADFSNDFSDDDRSTLRECADELRRAMRGTHTRTWKRID